MKAKQIRIPRVFADDHAERELPTPELVKAGPRHYLVSQDDPALAELLDDARFYASDEPDWNRDLAWLRAE